MSVGSAAAASVPWPVRARNTSSSVGFCTRHRGDADPGLPQGDQHLGGPVGVGERDVEPARLRRERPARPAAPAVRRTRRCRGRRGRPAAAGGSSCPPTTSARRGCPRRPCGPGRSPRCDPRAGRPRPGTAWSAAPCSRRRRATRIVSHIWPRVRGSRPVVGSSRKISGGRVIRLAARSSRRRMPPENCEIGLSAASSRPNCSSRRSGRAGAGPAAMPCSRANSQRFSRAVRFSSTEAYCPVTPSSWRIMCGLASYVDPEDLGLALVDRQQGGEHPQHGGLAGAVGAEHAEDLAAADLQVDAVHGALVRRRSSRARRRARPGRCLR